MPNALPTFSTSPFLSKCKSNRENRNTAVFAPLCGTKKYSQHRAGKLPLRDTGTRRTKGPFPNIHNTKQNVPERPGDTAAMTHPLLTGPSSVRAASLKRGHFDGAERERTYSRPWWRRWAWSETGSIAGQGSFTEPMPSGGRGEGVRPIFGLVCASSLLLVLCLFLVLSFVALHFACLLQLHELWSKFLLLLTWQLVWFSGRRMRCWCPPRCEKWLIVRAWWREMGGHSGRVRNWRQAPGLYLFLFVICIWGSRFGIAVL